MQSACTSYKSWRLAAPSSSRALAAGPRYPGRSWRPEAWRSSSRLRCQASPPATEEKPGDAQAPATQRSMELEVRPGAVLPLLSAAVAARHGCLAPPAQLPCTTLPPIPALPRLPQTGAFDAAVVFPAAGPVPGGAPLSPPQPGRDPVKEDSRKYRRTVFDWAE